MPANLDNTKSNKLVSGFTRSLSTKHPPEDLILLILFCYNELAMLIQRCLTAHDTSTEIKYAIKIRKLLSHGSTSDHEQTIVDSGISPLS